MQNKRGQTSKQLGEAETADVFQAFCEAILRRKAADPRFSSGGDLYGRKLVVFLDNAKWHTAGLKKFKKTAWYREQHVKDHIEFRYTPAMSPECNKVVEHYHGNSCAGFRAALRGLVPETLKIEDIVEIYRKEWFKFGEEKFLAGVRRDFLSLRETYQQLIVHHGSRVPRRFA